MKLVKENLWKCPPHPGCIVVTTNAFIKRNGALVMGRGAALEATQRIPGIAFECGRAISLSKRENMHNGYHRYLFSMVRFPQEGKIGFGLFQVKYHFKEQASLELIEDAVYHLNFRLGREPMNVRMNFPGIGYGGLKREDVLPIIQKLDDLVVVCER
jgi:hypothetical protein